MSVKNMLKRIFRVGEANVNSLVQKMTDYEKDLGLAATRVCDEIHRLEKGRIENRRRISELEVHAKTLNGDCDKLENQLKAMVAKGRDVPKSQAALALNKRKLAQALNAQCTQVTEANNKIDEALITLGDRLEEIKASIELARLQKDSEKYGVALAEDVDFTASMVGVDVDAILREASVFGRADGVTNASTSFEIEEYINSLSAK